MHTGEKNKVYRLTLGGRRFRITVGYSDVFPSGDDEMVWIDCRDIASTFESQAIITLAEARADIFRRPVYDACKSAYLAATGNDGSGELYGDFFTNGPKVVYPRKYVASGRYDYTAVDMYRGGDANDASIYGDSPVFAGSRKQAEKIAAALNAAFAAGTVYGAGPNYRPER